MKCERCGKYTAFYGIAPMRVWPSNFTMMQEGDIRPRWCVDCLATEPSNDGAPVLERTDRGIDVQES